MKNNRQIDISLRLMFGILFLMLLAQAIERVVVQDVHSSLIREMENNKKQILGERYFFDKLIHRAKADSSLSEESIKAFKKSNNAGVKAYYKKNYSKALEHFERALVLSERIEDENLKTRKRADTKFNIGHALRHLKRCVEALQYYDEALQYYAGAQSRTYESMTFYYQGWCLYNLERHVEAVGSFDSCIEIGKSVGLKPSYIKGCRTLRKRALVGSHNQQSSEYDDRDQGEYDQGYPGDQEPDGGYDDRYPYDPGPAEYDPGYPGEQAPGEYDPGYPGEQAPGGYDPGYPGEQAPGGYDPGYPGEQAPGEYDPGYPGEQAPGGYDPGYPGEQVPDGY